MADLREQMLKAGLISEDQARLASHEKKQENKNLGREGRARQKQAQQQEAQDQAQTRSQADQQRNRRREKQRQAKEQQLAEAQQRKSTISKVLKEGRVPNWEGNRAYYFADGKDIHALQVSDTAAKLLEVGQAAIVRENKHLRYTVIGSGMARTLREVAPEHLVTFHEPPKSREPPKH